MNDPVERRPPPDGPGRSRALVLVTGATGYIGGRLVRALHERGFRVRCLARRPVEARARLHETVEVVSGDVLEPASLAAALTGVDTAYYLIHAMASPGAFAQEERDGASNFAHAAREAGVRRIVYLGGLGGEVALSPHLASRHEVGRLLHQSGVRTIELRASVIIGSGSLSFELVRALVERLPVLIMPRWVRQPTQPLAIADVIRYLVAAAEVPLDESTVVEIGGRDRASYEGLMRAYAAQRGLRRLFVRVPVLTPWLSGRWLGLVTPVYARVGQKLIDSLRNETVVTSLRSAALFPEIEPCGMQEAIAQALANEDREIAETRWSDARSSLGTLQPWGGVMRGSRLVDSRTVQVPVAPADAFRPVEAIGGGTGWYYGTWLWKLRGFLDLLAGGPGMRRGRRDPHELRVGDALDFWRVESMERARLLRLRAEMKVPGRAWLQFEVVGDTQRSVIRQTAIFEPRGLAGLLYWYALFPLHQLIFAGMLRGVARAAVTNARRGVSSLVAALLIGAAPLAAQEARSQPGRGVAVATPRPFEGPSPWPAIRRARIARLLPAAMREAGVDAWVVMLRENANDPLALHVGGENAGAPSAVLLFRAARAGPDGGDRIRSVMLAGFGEAIALRELALHDSVVVYDGGVAGLERAVAERLAAAGPARIAVNSGGSGIADGLSWTQRMGLERALGPALAARLTSSDAMVRAWLAVKLPEEVAIMRRAAALTVKLEEEAYATIVPGVTRDRDLAAFLKRRMRELGVEDAWSPAQNPSVNSGPDRGHSHASDRVIQPGDVIQTDFGIKVHGVWVTDIQRFAYVLRAGERRPPTAVERRWRHAVAGGRAAFQAMRPGTSGAQVDSAQRLVMATAGSLPVPWGTGHAVGYWAHDAGPGLNRRETGTLAAGHVLAFDGFHAWAFDERTGSRAEPSPAWGAGTKTISVEEMAVVTANGAEYLVPPQERLILVPARGRARAGR